MANGTKMQTRNPEQRPTTGEASSSKTPRRAPTCLQTPAYATVGAVLIASVVALFGQARYGYPAAALAIAQGKRIILRQDVLALGECTSRKEVAVEIAVVNLSAAQARVVGGTATCTCITLNALPMDIPPRGSAAIPITIRVGDEPGPFSQAVTLYVDPGDGSGLQTLEGAITADVLGELPRVR